MKAKASDTKEFERLSNDLETVISKRGEPDEMTSGMQQVAKLCLEFLARHNGGVKEAKHPETMQLFGGFFQCLKIPLANALQGESPDLTGEEILKEAVLLFAASMQAFSLETLSAGECQSISQSAGRLCSGLTQAGGKIQAGIRARMEKKAKEIQDLNDLSRSENDLEAGIRKLKTNNSGILDRISKLRKDSEALSSELEKTSKDETEILQKVAGLRTRKKELEDARLEVKELTEVVDSGEKEINDLRKRKSELDQRKTEISKRIGDTREMLAEAEKTIDTTILGKIQEIWRLLPADKFDA